MIPTKIVAAAPIISGFYPILVVQRKYIVDEPNFNTFNRIFNAF